MPDITGYTAAQQAKIDAAQNRLNTAKDNWKGANDFWQQHFIDLKCYDDTKHDIMQAVSWFTPTDVSCTEKGSCTHSDKKHCQDEIALVRSKIGFIRSTYAELNSAQQNYDTVLNEVAQEIKNDPAIIHAKDQLEADTATNNRKWTFLGLIILVVILLGTYLGLKTEVKKGYIFGGGITLIIFFYLIFFGFKKS